MAKISLPHCVSFVPQDTQLWKEITKNVTPGNWYHVFFYGVGTSVAPNSKVKKPLGGGSWDSYRDTVCRLCRNHCVDYHMLHIRNKTILVIGMPGRLAHKEQENILWPKIKEHAQNGLSMHDSVKRAYLKQFLPPEQHPAAWEAANGCWNTYGCYLFLDQHVQKKRSAA